MTEEVLLLLVLLYEITVGVFRPNWEKMQFGAVGDIYMAKKYVCNKRDVCNSIADYLQFFSIANILLSNL